MTTFNEIREKTAELNKQIAALQAQAAEQIKPLLQQFITDNPQVEAVRWEQYTPYFNDGEACVFGVYGPYFKFAAGDDSDGDYEDGFRDGFGRDIVDGKRGYTYGGRFHESGPTLEACSVETQKACEALSTELNSLKGPLQSLFGDHVQVTVTKDGVEVEEYEHD